MSWHDRIPNRVTELADQIAPSRTALVLVDMQNDFVHDDGIFVKQWGKTNHRIKPIIPNCGRLLTAARECGVPPIHLRVVNDFSAEPGKLAQLLGSSELCSGRDVGADFVEELRPSEGETVITKYTYDGFVDTPLDSVLKKLQLKTLVFCGVDSDVCVRDTAAHGFALGYTPVFARDALAADNDTAHAGVLQSLAEHYGQVVTTEEIVALWKRPGPADV